MYAGFCTTGAGFDDAGAEKLVPVRRGSGGVSDGSGGASSDGDSPCIGTPNECWFCPCCCCCELKLPWFTDEPPVARRVGSGGGGGGGASSAALLEPQLSLLLSWVGMLVLAFELFQSF
jgi:hypothetical protein